MALKVMKVGAIKDLLSSMPTFFGLKGFAMSEYCYWILYRRFGCLFKLFKWNINISTLTSCVSSTATSSHSNHPMSINTKGRLGNLLEKSTTLRRMLFFIAIFGVCMLIGDGILTPAISVLSAMDGLRGPFKSVSKTTVEVLSIVVLLALFLLQRFGTSRVSFLFSPIMGAWTLTTPIIGMYSLLQHYPSIFKAVSPHYIVHFFWRNKSKGWELLGGTVLCITGVEATFADLGHFNKRSIQMAFLLAIYPSLIITYAGQTAYLIKHPNDHYDGFYKFIPQPVYWPMFVIATSAAIVASQSLISATFSVIKQSMHLDCFPRVKLVHTSQSKEGEVYSPEANYILMILCMLAILGFGDGRDIGNAFGVVVILVMFITTILLTLVMIVIWRAPLILVMLYFVVFFILEGVYVSAVLTKIPEGGWFPFVISIILAFIVFAWYYGRQKKLDCEVKEKLSLDNLRDLLSSLEIQKVPGLCIFYSKIQDGFTPLLRHHLRSIRSLHEVTIFTTFRYLLVPKVNPCNKIIIKKLGIHGLYGCTIQYGFADSFNLEGDDYVSQVINILEDHIRQNCDGHSPDTVNEEILQLESAKEMGVIHVHGKTRFHISKKTTAPWISFLLEFYEFLHRNCRSALPVNGIPTEQVIDIGMVYNV
ncbi:hypothetical protein HPP92_018757 [Vanilla planifolia]|uniref:Potassium transporter n=1 Tax=Vanilla planifolia TaxID=51239 RepID=A0A835Q4J9_VANPL|nr:hypothetical protein HPP92_018757 [Vanilla planifolia]